MEQKLETIIRYFTGTGGAEAFPAKINMTALFQQDSEESSVVAGSLNAAFLVLLSGESHPLHSAASLYINKFRDVPSWRLAVDFYEKGLRLIVSEITELHDKNDTFREDVNNLHLWLSTPDALRKNDETVEKVRRVFFPEGAEVCDHREEKIHQLREKRLVNITNLNPAPVAHPARELIITSNILVTVPPASGTIDDLHPDSPLKEKLKQISGEEQVYWYDHPIPVGISPEHNEILYGLEHLDRAVAFEKQRGVIGETERVICILSVSVTHEGLHEIVRDYIADELKKEKKIRHLDIYVFTESDTMKLLSDVLVPAAGKYIGPGDHHLLQDVIGVDGEYGRHYTFLKAIAAFWQVFISSGVKGTFKIDLDQVFPQDELVEQSGLSAFEHLMSPLWGAEGVDSQGNTVELGLIAGALVNQTDIEKSLFSPDVCFPPDSARADEMVFFSALPQALSTEAEMMTRYSHDSVDGVTQCIQRIHVTGGTNGILISSLRKYRPFTPTFIGRAEDQAYILSILFSGKGKMLRYVHKDGLIMRHDKETFASDAIKTAAVGKLIGDYIRILMFSYYAKALPWALDDMKETIDPFTGCFVSKIPFTVVYLRFALKVAALFSEHAGSKNEQGMEFFHTGIKRLYDTIRELTQEPNPLVAQFKKEKKGWALYYETLDRVEQRIRDKDPSALELQKKAENLIDSCKIHF